jgi:hypothetical protein
MSEKADDNESIKQQESTSQESNVLLVEWSPENEKIVVEWCDIAQCYKWLHTRAHQKFSYMHAWFTIPAIILSTISGTASFAQGSLPLSMQTLAPMVIGSVNIFIGILTTIQQYLKISEYNESHRVSAIAWDKFARNIRIELAKHPDERSTDAGHFLKTNRDEFDRLMETSPSIPIPIVDEFLETFSGQPVRTWYDCCSKKKKTEQKLKKEEEMKKKALMFEKLKKPDVCNIIVSADDNRHPWYKEASKPPSVKSDDVLLSVVSHKINKIQQEYEKKISLERERALLEMEMKEHEEIEKKRKQDLQLKFINNTVAVANKVKEQHRIIDSYVQLFSENHGRRPLKDEIRLALQDQTDEDILNKFLDNYKTSIEEEDFNFDIQFDGDDRV